MPPQVVGQLFGVYLPIFKLQTLILKQHQIFKNFLFHKFYQSFAKNFFFKHLSGPDS